jgi:Holliday junction DNA helicase RuvB
VGIETIASLLGEEASTVEEVYEPFLLRQGFLEKTARGRQIPQKALRYLQRKYLGQEHLG